MKDTTANAFKILLRLLGSGKATIPLAALLLLSFAGTAMAQGTVFTYQGQLSTSNAPANGSYDLTFALFNASSGGSQAGTTITNAGVSVTDGLFTVMLDFGNQFNGTPYWLQIGVRTNASGAFTTLSPRQPLTPVPYSLFASNTTLLNGQASSAFAPASGSGAYVTKSGDTMTGTLNLPANGLVVGGNQLVVTGGNIGIGTSSPAAHFSVDQPSPGGDAFVAEFGPVWNNGSAYNDGDQCVIIQAWNGSPSLSLSRNNVRGYLFEVDPSGALLFKNGYNGGLGELMRFQPWGGNVGIGTTNPATALDVNGTVTATAFAGDGSGLTNLINVSAAKLVSIGNTSGGIHNFFVGPSGNSTTSGSFNVAIGDLALEVNSSGRLNTAEGQQALSHNTSGSWNTAIGAEALWILASGSNNIALGSQAGYNIAIGNNNIHIGNVGYGDDNNIVRIGDRQTATYLAGTVYANGVALTSDRNAKENVTAVNAREVLAKVAALPVTRWSFKTDGKDVRHIGPMAQDFQAAFQLSADDKHISVVDEGGVALAAIQGLNQKLQEELNRQGAENAKLKQQNDSLAARLNELEATVMQLAAQK